MAGSVTAETGVHARLFVVESLVRMKMRGLKGESYIGTHTKQKQQTNENFRGTWSAGRGGTAPSGVCVQN